MKDKDALVEASIARVTKHMSLFNEALQSDIKLIIQHARKVADEPDLIALRALAFDEAIEQIHKLKASDSDNDKSNSPKKTGRRRRSIGDIDVTEEAKDDMRLRLLEARLESDEAYERESKKVIKELGMQNCRNRNRTLGGLAAHSQGKYRDQFIRRYLARIDDDSREQAIIRLARACSLQDGEILNIIG